MVKKKTPDNNITQNRKARHDFAIDETFEAGLVLEGWEVKSLRAGHGQLKDSYVKIRKGEAWLIGSHIPPLLSASTHIKPEPLRDRKLLLHKKQLKKLIGATERKGFTLVALSLYWKNGVVKASIALAKGQKQYEKRDAIKQRDLQREASRGSQEY